jgi:hypothetical protein
MVKTRLNIVKHTCNLRLRQEDHKFEAILDYVDCVFKKERLKFKEIKMK